MAHRIDHLGIGNTTDGTGIGGLADHSTGGGCGNRFLIVVRTDLITEGQRVIVVDGQREYHFNTAGDLKLVCSIAQNTGAVQGGRGGIFAQPTVSHIPCGTACGLDGNIAGFSEGGNQLAVFKLILAQIVGIGLTGVVRSVDIAEEVEVSQGTQVCRTASGAAAFQIAVSGGGNGIAGIAV